MTDTGPCENCGAEVSLDAIQCPDCGYAPAELLRAKAVALAALPVFLLSLVTGTVFGLGLFVLGLLYALMGFFRLELSGKPLLAFLASHVLYGLVHGFVTGFWLTLLEPLV